MKKIFFCLVSLLSLTSFSFADGVAPAAQSGGAFGGLMPLILIFIFFYLFLIRPQQKQRKEHQKMLDALKKDDKIITAGGLYATVVSVKGDTVEAKISDNVRIQIVKQTISTVIVPQTDAVTPEVIKK